MERSASPVSNTGSFGTGSSPHSSPVPEEDAAPNEQGRTKKTRKKRKTTPLGEEVIDGDQSHLRKPKKAKSRRKEKGEEGRPKKSRKQSRKGIVSDRDAGLSPAQLAVNEQMRRALEEDQYSANGSIVDTDSDDDDHQHTYKGQSIRLDRNHLMQAARKHLWLERVNGGSASTGSGTDDPDGRRAGRKKKKKGKRSKDDDFIGALPSVTGDVDQDTSNEESNVGSVEKVFERDESSIFGQTTGSSNSTWVECDKCGKWRRLRGVVDERKLPPKWYCSMNKNDPERAKCSAPEEEYDASHTPESAADSRSRKHLRVWVRRLQCNEAYESRQPTLTRGKKRAAASSSKDPYEWIRCCNPSCGKWRAILRIMDARSNVIERCNNGEWYCVMNTWDEKTASCAAPQENLPAVGCPPWVMQEIN
ncbi:unnamed protein product [Cylindrotheca closterium]|uniref:CW-type domain-containing protein n=1 Tax=Cylindrotheca closterium TaxID=2856 RepID=A0AAD2G2L7_9STRA|nr:unnamed protein product [Cylindrotheca closterium]